ncbi:MAG: carboxypeptidase regulatory-like domain-containing protein, partial [Candidatus Solibacter usitatus]|nr:carboxypeptidase regulatory-like domain-containing protein [Candidatus Solibacter usitatus]
MRIAFLFPAVCAALLAQSSGIQGLVADPSGAPVLDATVTVRNLATGVSSEVRTNERGLYSA